MNSTQEILMNDEPRVDEFHSHLALILASLAVGDSQLTGLAKSAALQATAQIMRQLGANVVLSDNNNTCLVQGAGLGVLQEPTQPIKLHDCGDQASLVIGLLAGHNLTATFVGQGPHEEHCFEQLISLLEPMGAHFTARSGGKLPMVVCGPRNVLASEIELNGLSEATKWAALLCGLNARGETRIIERKSPQPPQSAQSPSAKIARAFGVDLCGEVDSKGYWCTKIMGQPVLRGTNIGKELLQSGCAF